MNEKSFINTFQLCWDVILEESSKQHGTFFNSEHCKIQDSTDTNFDVLENRLAYTYKYGSYNILFFEKCFLNFLNECLDFETIFPLKNLKMCSLSNGPGFDIIGLLCALCRSNKSLKSFPKINAINIFDSWSTLYEILICKAYDVISLRFMECSQKMSKVKPGNISLIQGDVFSTLSDEAKKCISNSNVLLMVKAYFSSKTTVNKFASSLKKIFLLLKPGALVFFIGSENNMTNFSRRSFLSNYVKTIYGPQKVTLTDITIDENISNIIGHKPAVSGTAEFVVWQKIKTSDREATEKDSNKNKRKFKEDKDSKKINKILECIGKEGVTANEGSIEEPLDETIVASDHNYNSDVESELSGTCGSKLSAGFASKSDSYSDEFNSANSGKMKSEISPIPLTFSQGDSIHSADNAASFLGYFDSDASDSENESQRKFYTNLENGMFVVDDASSLSGVNYTSSFDIIKDAGPQVQENSTLENKDNLNFKYFKSDSGNTKFSAVISSDVNAIENACIENTKENVMLFMSDVTDQHDEMSARNDPQLSSQENQSSFNQTCENLLKEENTVLASLAANAQKTSEKLNDTDKPSLHLLIQRCENLVTALEKLTVSSKRDMDSSKYGSGFNKLCSGHSHHCCCCVKIIHTCCCRKMCNC